jgi:hypothetical protein
MYIFQCSVISLKFCKISAFLLPSKACPGALIVMFIAYSVSRWIVGQKLCSLSEFAGAPLVVFPVHKSMSFVPSLI